MSAAFHGHVDGMKLWSASKARLWTYNFVALPRLIPLTCSCVVYLGLGLTYNPLRIRFHQVQVHTLARTGIDRSCKSGRTKVRGHSGCFGGGLAIVLVSQWDNRQRMERGSVYP
jgi:hypothetical protein